MTTAVIAEDETLLAETLAELLYKVWPQLQVAAIAPDGEAALAASCWSRTTTSSPRWAC